MQFSPDLRIPYSLHHNQERELEKVNAFYLQKEAEVPWTLNQVTGKDSLVEQLRLRLRTLLDKKRVMQSRNASTSKISASFITFEEGFQRFGNDLNKLQVKTFYYG